MPHKDTNLEMTREKTPTRPILELQLDMGRRDLNVLIDNSSTQDGDVIERLSLILVKVPTNVYSVSEKRSLIVKMPRSYRLRSFKVLRVL